MRAHVSTLSRRFWFFNGRIRKHSHLRLPIASVFACIRESVPAPQQCEPTSAGHTWEVQKSMNSPMDYTEGGAAACPHPGETGYSAEWDGGAACPHPGETGYSAEWDGGAACPHPGETGYSAEQAVIVAAGSRS